MADSVFPITNWRGGCTHNRRKFDVNGNCSLSSSSNSIISNTIVCSTIFLFQCVYLDLFGKKIILVTWLICYNHYIMQMCESSYFHYLPWGRCHDKRFHQLEGFGCFLFAKTLLAEVSRLHGTSVPPSNFPTRKFLWRWKHIINLVIICL